MSLSKRIFKNTTLSIFAKTSNTAFRLLTTLVVARYLTVEGYGQYAFTIALISFTAFIADFGSQQIVTREISGHKDKTKGIVGSVFILRVFISILLLIAIFLFIHFLDVASPVKTAVYIVTIPQLMVAFNTLFLGVFYADDRFGFEAVIALAARGGEFIFVIGVVVFDLGFTAFFVSMAIVHLLITILGTVLYLSNYGLPTFRIDLGYWKHFIFEALPIAITTLFMLAALRVDIFILAALRGFEEVAFFGIPQAIIQSTQIVHLGFVSVMFPILCRLWKAKERDKYIFAYQKAFKILYVVGLPINLMIFCFSKDIMGFFGTKYLASAIVLRLLAVGGILLFLNSLNMFSLVSINKQRLNILCAATGFMFKLVLDILLIPRYGYTGAAIATVVSYCGLFAASFYFVLHGVGRLNLLNTVVRPVFAIFPMALFMVYFANATPFIILPAGIIIYLLSLLLFKAFSLEDISFRFDRREYNYEY